MKHFSLRTEETEVGWPGALCSGMDNAPEEMGAAEVEAFLPHLEVNRGLATASLKPGAQEP